MPKKNRWHAGPHKYLRIKWKRTKRSDPYVIFKCQLPGCSSYKDAYAVVGDQCVCWKCGESFQMTRASVQLARPHCVSCTGPSNRFKSHAKELSIIEANLDKLLEKFD
jgi:hypothetical protein